MVEGHISSDAEWDYHLLTNVVIDPGVTVTIPAGGDIWLPEDGFFYIEGTLIVAGEEGDEAAFTVLTSGTWDGIVVNATGMVDIRNATINFAHQGIVLGGIPSVVENTEISNGDEGIAISSPGNRIESCFIYNQNIAGIQFRSSTGPNYINDTEIDKIGGVGLGLDTTTGVITNDLVVGYSSPGIEIQDSSDLVFLQTTVMPVTQSLFTWGIYMDGAVRDVLFDDLLVDNFHVGVNFITDSGTNVIFDHAALGPELIGGVNLESGGSIHAIFVNSSIDATGDAIEITDPDDLSLIELINTTLDGGSIIINDGGSITQSWFLDLTVIDGNGDPLDCLVDIWNGTNSLISSDLPSGVGLNLPILSVVWFIGTDTAEKAVTNLEITSNDGSNTNYVMDEGWFYQNEEWSIMMDLVPYNNFTTDIEFEEDGKIDIELYDYFVDPEGEDLIWDIMTGPDLKYKTIQHDEVLRLETAEDNWFGTSWVNINATDAGGNWTEVNATVTVTPINDPPVLLEDLPELTTTEDTPVWINFSGRAEDVEGDALTWSADEIDNCTLSWDDDVVNLTVTPDENWFGILQIPVSVSDGTANPEWILTVNVTPVNDPPMAKVLWSNGTEADQVEYVWNETVNITVWEITTAEDVPVEFGFFYDDVETVEPTSILVFTDLMHGALDLTVYQREEIINATTNETEMVDYTIVTNYTYTPKGNDFAGDLIQFNISDGEEEVTLWIWFNVESVNDRPEFDAPDEWNVTVEMDNKTTVDIGDWMSDVDGDVLTISVDPDEYITLNGTQLEIHYNDTFEGDHQNVTVTISDGILTAGAVLLINITREEEPGPGPDDDDDDDEFDVTNPQVESTEDEWTVTVEGEEGQNVYLAVVDEDGTVTYHKMDYVDGKYEVTLDKDDADEGFDYYFTDEDGGDPIIEGGSLPELKEEKDDPFPWWIIAVVLAILLIGIIIILMLGKGAGSSDLDEE